MDYTVRTPIQLAKVLRGQRKTMGASQQQLSGTVGLLPKTISKLELDPDTASIESLFKLLSALRLELVVRPQTQQPSLREW